MTLARTLERWKLVAARESMLALRDALAMPATPELVERVVLAAIVSPEILKATAEPIASSIVLSGFPGVEIANALACVGVSTAAQAPDELPRTPRGALAALVAQGRDAAAKLVPASGDVAEISRKLLSAHDQNAAFAAWHAIVRSAVSEEADAPTLLWVARVVLHDLCGKPLGSVGAWVRDTLDHEVKVEADDLAQARRRAHVQLVEDPDRLRASPESRLRMWERAAKPLRALVDVPLGDLGCELSRTVLVYPRQALDAARRILDRLAAASPVTPEERLPVADAINALACAGVEIPDMLRTRVAAWLPGLTAVEPAMPGRIRGALAALAHGDVDRARYVAREPRGELVGRLVFPNDMLALVGYLGWAVRVRASFAAIEDALDRVGEELDALCESGQLDEAAILWFARVAFHRVDREPLGDVAIRAHEWLWGVPRELEQARRDATTHQAAFPLGRTLGGGRYRVDQWLEGTGSQRLYRGVDAAGGRVMIAVDDHSPRRQSLDELRAATAYGAPGLFELAYVGTFDDDRDHWAIVERVPVGDWLPRIRGPAEPSKAIALGLSAGRILQRAAQTGIVLAQIRPELMWARGRDVTGLSARAIELFARRRAAAFTRPLFERWYRAPEAAADPDDRAVAFALAVMIAEWATGRYPLRSAFGRETAEHEPIDVPGPLGALLARTIRANRDDRPRLDEFLAALVAVN